MNRAVKQWNQIVREHIRNESGLRLSDGDRRNSIQVRVVEGFPTPLASFIDRRPPIVGKVLSDVSRVDQLPREASSASTDTSKKPAKSAIANLAGWTPK